MAFMYITVRKGLTGGKVNPDVEIFFSTGKESLFKARRELGIPTQQKFFNGSAGSFLDVWA